MVKKNCCFVDVRVRAEVEDLQGKCEEETRLKGLIKTHADGAFCLWITPRLPADGRCRRRRCWYSSSVLRFLGGQRSLNNNNKITIALSPSLTFTAINVHITAGGRKSPPPPVVSGRLPAPPLLKRH